MKDLYEKYQGYLPAAFFLGGFLFDILTTDRIDQGFSLITQLIYLLLIYLLFYWEVLTPKVFQQEGKFVTKMWAFHVEALHFLFGCLLSLYTIFYFKSSSFMTSFLFMTFLAGILVINELPQFQKRGLLVRSLLLSLCTLSYLIYLVPVMIGTIGWFPFVVALALSVSLFLLFSRFILSQHEDSNFIKKNMVAPGLIVPAVFFILYFFKALPPVPISLKYVGIYHQVSKEQGNYVLEYERPWWVFWQSGAQTFLKREGDKIHCFVSVFSPTQFKDQMQLVWYKKGKNGWNQRDSVPLKISGGRDAGYRGFSFKSNYEIGEWQVRIKTSDDREVGRISFEIVNANLSKPRVFKRDRY